MNKNQLKYFVAAAETLSFTKTAEQFYISQTAITQQIHALEEYLGCTLFERSTRPVSLTPAGRTFLVEAKAILERMERAEERVREASTGLAGTLRIGYVRGYERGNLTGLVRNFHTHHANILMTFYRCYTDVLAAGLLNNEYDMIFTWDSTNLKQNKDVEYITFERSKLIAVLYSNHPFAHREVLERKELKSENLIFASQSSEKDSFGDVFFMNLYKRSGYTPNILARCSDLESALMMVDAEEGISILPQYCIEKLTNADNLVFVPLSGEDEEEEIIAAWRRDAQNPALKLLVGMMKDML